MGRRADDLFIGLVLGPAPLAQYAVGYRVLTTITETMLHPADRASTAAVALAAKGSSHEAGIELKKNQRKVMAIAAPIFAAAGLLSYILIPKLIGATWQQAASCSLILCLAGAVQSTYWLTYTGLFRIVGHRFALMYQSILVPILLTPTLVGTLAGPIGCSWGYLLGACGGWVLASICRRRIRPSHIYSNASQLAER